MSTKQRERKQIAVGSLLAPMRSLGAQLSLKNGSKKTSSPTRSLRSYLPGYKSDTYKEVYGNDIISGPNTQFAYQYEQIMAMPPSSRKRELMQSLVWGSPPMVMQRPWPRTLFPQRTAESYPEHRRHQGVLLLSLIMPHLPYEDITKLVTVSKDIALVAIKELYRDTSAGPNGYWIEPFSAYNHTIKAMCLAQVQVLYLQEKWFGLADDAKLENDRWAKFHFDMHQKNYDEWNARCEERRESVKRQPSALALRVQSQDHARRGDFMPKSSMKNKKAVIKWHARCDAWAEKLDETPVYQPTKIVPFGKLRLVIARGWPQESTRIRRSLMPITRSPLSAALPASPGSSSSKHADPDASSGPDAPVALFELGGTAGEGTAKSSNAPPMKSTWHLLRDTASVDVIVFNKTKQLCTSKNPMTLNMWDPKLHRLYIVWHAPERVEDPSPTSRAPTHIIRQEDFDGDIRSLPSSCAELVVIFAPNPTRATWYAGPMTQEHGRKAYSDLSTHISDACASEAQRVVLVGLESLEARPFVHGSTTRRPSMGWDLDELRDRLERFFVADQPHFDHGHPTRRVGDEWMKRVELRTMGDWVKGLEEGHRLKEEGRGWLRDGEEWKNKGGIGCVEPI